MPVPDKYNVICIKWGDRYSPDYVNRLYNMVTRNTQYSIEFYCFTDNATGLDDRIRVYPIPVLKGDPIDRGFCYRKEAGLCDDNLGDLNGQRVFFFDLDVVFVDNIDSLFSYPSGEEFVIINDWNSKGDQVGQASCYSWVVGTLGYVKADFEKNPEDIIDKYFTASQEYLSAKIIEQHGRLNFWPDSWFRSFRFHCMPLGIFRKFVTPSIPAGSKIIVFHGNPNPHEAIEGVWSYSHPAPWWKRFYKTVRPTLWIKDYWH